MLYGIIIQEDDAASTYGGGSGPLRYIKEVITLYEIISSLLKYIFITIIYLFIFAIIRMIYLDIRSMNTRMSTSSKKLPCLRLLNHDTLELETEEQYALKDNMTIGRDSDNHIAVNDTFLSGRHAMFMRQDGSYFIKDLDTTNGTFVNGEKLADTPMQLKDGDKIQLGQLNFLYVDGREVK